MGDKETSYAPFVDLEIKSDGDNGIVDGYASVFDHRDQGRDRVMPGAFTKTLQERGKYIIYLPSHDYKAHVKDIPGVPLEVREDAKGLFTSTKFFLNTQAGRDSFAVIKAYQEAGRPLGLSFTFKPTAKGSKYTSKGRDLSEVDLYEYGHTALPMHDLARTTGAKASVSTNEMMHSEEVDHAHHHGETTHSHPHAHKSDGYYGGSHSNHDHTAEQMKSLVVSEEKHYWADTDEAELNKLVTAGIAMEGKLFPITDENDLASALEEFENGRVVKVNDVRKHIIARAKSIGQEDMLPDEWSGNKIFLYLPYVDTKDNSIVTAFEDRIGKKLSEEDSTKFRAALAVLQELQPQEEDIEATNRKNIEEQKSAAEAARIKNEIDAALEGVRI